MHSRYTGVRWRKRENFILNRLGIILESAPIAIFCLEVTETKGQTFHGVPGFYSTSYKHLVTYEYADRHMTNYKHWRQYNHIVYNCETPCDLHTDPLWLTHSRDTFWLTVIHYTQSLRHTDTWQLTHKHCLFVTYKYTDTCDLQRTFCDLKHTDTLWLMHTQVHTNTLWLMSVCDLQMHRHLWLTNTDILWLTNAHLTY